MNAPANFDKGIFLLRIALGSMALSHGLLKIFVFTLPGTVAFFGQLGLPAFVAYGTVAIEIAAGVALLAGAYTRYAALALVPVLVGASWAHFGNGWLFSNPGGGWEYPVFLTVALVAQSFLGSGAFALDTRTSEAATARSAL